MMSPAASAGVRLKPWGNFVSRHPGLAAEFDSILFSFLDPRANFIDNPDLQQGILWGIGTYTAAAPDKFTAHRSA